MKTFTIAGIAMFWMTLALAATPPPQPQPWLRTDFPISVMHLEGTFTQMGEQHGAFAKQSPAGIGLLNNMSSGVSDFINSTTQIPGFLKKFALWFYNVCIRKPLADHMPDEYKDYYTGFAKAVGMDRDQIINAIVVPDTSLYIQDFMQSLGVLAKVKTVGCTSIFWDTRDGGTHLFGRNLDFSGAGIWDRNQLIVHSVPVDGLASVTMSGLGLPVLGITGFNEAGLGISVHQLNIHGNRTDAVPMFVTLTEITRKAHSIDEAISIIRHTRRAGGWIYVLSQGADKASVESTPQNLFVHRTSDVFFSVTSHAHGPKIQKQETFMNPGDLFDSLERSERLDTYGQSIADSQDASPEMMGELLADRYKVATGNPASLEVVQAAVIDAEHRRLWIGVGSDLVAPNQGKFVGYEWKDLRSSDAPTLIGEFGVAKNHTPLDVTLNGILRQVQIAGTFSDDQKILSLLSQYVTVARGGAALGQMERGTWTGLYLYVWQKLYLQGATLTAQDFADLSSVLDLALKDPDLMFPTRYAHYRRSMGGAFQARLLDLRGLRDQALGVYALVMAQAPLEPTVLKAVKDGLKNPWEAKKTQDLNIGLDTADLLIY